MVAARRQVSCTYKYMESRDQIEIRRRVYCKIRRGKCNFHHGSLICLRLFLPMSEPTVSQDSQEIPGHLQNIMLFIITYSLEDETFLN